MTNPVVDETPIRREDRSSRSGAIHVRQLDARNAETCRPLLFLHPSPYSGAYFETVMSLLNDDRKIIAPDYPGYGNSALPTAPPSISDYALAMLDVLESLAIEQVDIVGFHTGCLVGAEMSLREPDKIASLNLIDIPYYVGEARRDMYARAVEPDKTEDAYTRWGFHAAFTYASDERLPLVATPATVIATQSRLLEPTRLAARILPNCRLIERLDITRPVFEDNARRIAGSILEALN
jgi:pimeloyl-ACP methyl ester carboxylesterase